LAGRIKKKEHEKLDDTNIELVIKLLEQAKPITKKEAYERLNIAANSARLTKIIDDFKERREREKRFRAANRGKPATDHEIQQSILGYLDGLPLTEIADSLYRSSNFVKSIIDKIGVPQRGVGDYIRPDILPEQCVVESFKEGQLVWSPRYDGLAIVEKRIPSTDYDCYKIYVIERIEEPCPFNLSAPSQYGGKYAVQAVFDLGSLEHLKDHGVDLYKPLRPYFSGLLENSS
jgi:hypothetical protein